MRGLFQKKTEKTCQSLSFSSFMSFFYGMAKHFVMGRMNNNSFIHG